MTNDIKTDTLLASDSDKRKKSGLEEIFIVAVNS